MAEEKETPKAHEGADGAAHEGGGHSDPMHHIKDRVIVGLNQNGVAVWNPDTHPYHEVHDLEGEIAKLKAKAEKLGKDEVVEKQGIEAEIKVLEGEIAAIKHEHGYYEAKTVGGILKIEFTQHMLNVTVAALLVGVMVMAVARHVLARIKTDQAPKGPMANAIEGLLQYVRDDLVIPIGGHHLIPYTPLFMTYFFFIFTCNMLGLIPFFGTGTGNIGVTAALGGSIFVLMTGLGMIYQGPISYFLHLVPSGIPFVIQVALFPIELFGSVLKCGVLCMRLFSNMIGGHLVISNLLGLGVLGKAAVLTPPALAAGMLIIGVPLALGISLLEVLVCFVQAYVFMLLSIIFVGGALHADH